MELADEHDPHAGTDLDTMRHLAFVVGALVVVAFGLMGVVALVVFLLLTAPIAGHMIGRAALRTGVPLWQPGAGDRPEP